MSVAWLILNKTNLVKFPHRNDFLDQIDKSVSVCLIKQAFVHFLGKIYFLVLNLTI